MPIYHDDDDEEEEQEDENHDIRYTLFPWALYETQIWDSWLVLEKK